MLAASLHTQLSMPTAVSALPSPFALHNGDFDGTVQPTLAPDVILGATVAPTNQLRACLVLEGTEGTLLHQNKPIC